MVMAGSKCNCMGKRDSDGEDYWTRIKHASERECWVYENRVALGLDTILAKGFKVDLPPGNQLQVGASRVRKVKTTGESQVKYHCCGEGILAPTGSTRLLANPLLGLRSNGKESDLDDEIIYIDVKVGRNTKSGTQIRLENGVDATVKWHVLRHNFLDKTRKNRTYGFDFKNELKEKLAAVKYQLNIHSDHRSGWDTLSATLNEDFKKIENALENVTKYITFVGTSVLIAINTTDLSASRAMLIDPDHPILLSNPLDVSQVPESLMTKTAYEKPRIGETDTTWDDYISKWKTGFSVGMTNLIDYFRNLDLTKDDIPNPKDVSAKLEGRD
jgi:hypothetical protein